MRLEKLDLRDRFLEGLSASGALVAFTGDPARHPFDLLVRNNGRSDRVRVYIWNISHGGKPRAADEFRIQVTGVSTIDVVPDAKTLLLGYFQGNSTFVGWDSARHAGPQAHSPSLQIREEYLNRAAEFGLSLYEKGNEVVVAFSPQFASQYVADLLLLHGSVLAVDRAVIEAVTESAQSNPIPDPSSTTDERRRQIQSFARLYREGDFRRRVLSAYGQACAFCGVQLELVEAAHLIPVSYPGSTDATSNGVCLCPSHHRALDQGMLALAEDYRVLVSRARIQDLRNRKLAEGEQAFFQGLRTQAIVPVEPGLRPTVGNVIVAQQARNLKLAQLVAYGDL